ncbi:aldo/keto reductase [Dankookia sp. P2]|uniref:aldo/keto reductase n=1 Tax=Dankookia sp. P2 TaxID=3423955 RepID=UPI003D67271D
MLAPGLKPHLPVPAFTQPRFNVFDTSALRSSIETSLRELRTDRIDILLLHEIGVEDAARPELLVFLDGLVREGKIGAFGLATSFDETSRIIPSSPGLTNVVQFPSSAWDRNIEKLPELPDSLLVTHSCLGRRFHALRERLSADGDTRERFNNAVGFDLSDAGTLARLCLAHALWSDPDGIVLFSSFKPANIQANATLAKSAPMDTQVLSSFAQLLSEAEQSRLAA